MRAVPRGDDLPPPPLAASGPLRRVMEASAQVAAALARHGAALEKQRRELERQLERQRALGERQGQKVKDLTSRPERGGGEGVKGGAGARGWRRR